MNQEKLLSLIEWKKKVGTAYFDIKTDFINPMIEALGDDEAEIIDYLKQLSAEDLEIVSSCFEYLYKKFTTDTIYDALENLQNPIQF